MRVNVAVQGLLSDKQGEIQALCARFGVRRLWLFGSAVSERWSHERSDLDFAAEFLPPTAEVDAFTQFFGFQVAMEELLGRKIDLVELPVIWKAHLAQTVRETAQQIYAA